MGDREEQTVRVRPPGAGLGTEGGGGGQFLLASGQEPGRESLLGPWLLLLSGDGAHLSPQVTRWVENWWVNAWGRVSQATKGGPWGQDGLPSESLWGQNWWVVHYPEYPGT